jgi:hypothetical protein
MSNAFCLNSPVLAPLLLPFFFMRIRIPPPLLLLAALPGTSLCPAFAGRIEDPPLFLEVGEQRPVALPLLEKFSVSGESLRYWRDPRRNLLLLKAAKPGLSTLLIEMPGGGTRSRTIRVEQKGRGRPPELLRAISGLETMEVIDSGPVFVIRGTIRSLPEASLLATIRERFPKDILDETTIEEGWAAASERAIRNLLAGKSSVSLRCENGECLIEGDVATSIEAETLIKRIHAIQPLIRTEIHAAGTAPSTLYFKIFLLELKRDLLSQLGVAWPDLHPGTLQFNPLRLTGKSTMDLAIHALSEKGMARILSSPELVVKAPGQAELFAGGELPIRQRSRFNDNVTWKPFGLSLKIDVKDYGGERVKIGIETEISPLDNDSANDSIPALRSNRIKTLVDGRMGSPPLLSGLLQEDFRERRRGLEGLSNLPVLGPLFSSRDFQNRRSELVAILLPHRNPPASPQSRLQSGLPRGMLPLPRNHLSEDELESARREEDYPWNVL